MKTILIWTETLVNLFINTIISIKLIKSKIKQNNKVKNNKTNKKLSMRNKKIKQMIKSK